MLKKITAFILAALCLAQGSFAGETSKLTLKDSQHLEWFKEAKFGMFICWGLYSVLEGSYKGRTLPDPSLPNGKSWYAEWIWMRLNIPDEEYKKLATTFNPDQFDADAWILEAKRAGMKYVVIVSKFHDGFALWDSKVSDFNIMNTPFKRDAIAELVAACKKHGLKYGFYYSHWQDWEPPNGAIPGWKKNAPHPDFEKYWKEKCLPQVKELIDRFDPDMLWFDTWGSEKNDITPERRDELIALVRANSDKCLINGRIRFIGPGDNIDFLEMHDNSYPESILSKPWQTPATMNHSWGWHANDFSWKSPVTMLGYLVSNTSKGGNYLLDVGPKGNGQFPEAAIRRLREMGGWLHANGESVYGTSPVDMHPETKGVYLTKKEMAGHQYLYASITSKLDKITLPIRKADILDCTILETRMPIRSTGSETTTTFEIPGSAYHTPGIIVLRIKLKSRA